MTNSAVNRSASDASPAKAPAFSRLVRVVTSAPVLVLLALSVATLAVYLPAVGFDFLNYDDPDYVTENPHVLGGISAKSVWWAFTATHAFNWHPVTWLSHMLDIELFGPGPAGPHLVNVLLHTANALFVLILLWRLTGRLWPSAFVAALFALHPLRVESVAWVSERKDVLSTFFGLLTLLFYAGYAARQKTSMVETHLCNAVADTKKARYYYVIALVCFALGLMSKPMLVTWPFLMLLLDYWPLNRLGEISLKNLHQLKMLALEKVPFFVLSVASSIVTLAAQKHGGAVQAWMPLWARLENAVVSYARYLGKIFWPFELAVPYPHPGKWPGQTVILATLLVLVVSAVVWWLRRSRPYAFVGWFWFIGTMVPVIGVVQVGLQAMADRYTYFPSIGVMVVLCWLGSELVERRPKLRRALTTTTLVLIAGLAVRTTAQLKHWQNTETLFSHTIRCTKDNADAWSALGNYKLKLGKPEEALRCYEQALATLPGMDQVGSSAAELFLETNPTNFAFAKFKQRLKASPSLADACAQLLNNYGFALAKMGRVDEAISWYRAALEVKPNYAFALLNCVFALHKLGVELAQNGNHSNAVQFFTAALTLAPKEPTVHYGLARSLNALGQFALAVQHFRKALPAFANDPVFHEQLGVCLAETGAVAEAIKHYQTALELNPRLFKTRNNLGAALLSLGRYDEAIEQLRAAIQLNGAYAPARENLGIALAAKGELNDAVVHLRAAIELEPDVASTHFNLGTVLAQQQKLHAAAAAFRQTLQLEPNHVPALCNLAGVLVQLGDTAEAVQHLRKAVALAPEFTPAHELLRKLQEQSQ